LLTQTYITNFRAVKRKYTHIVGQSFLFCHAADSYLFLASSWTSLQPSCYRFFCCCY